MNISELRQNAHGAGKGTAESGSRWRAGLILFISLLGLIGVYWDTVESMVSIWLRSDTYAHGFVIVPISLYMIWERRNVLAGLAMAPGYSGLFVLFLCTFMWLLAWSANVLFVQQLAVVAMIPVLIWTVLGRKLVYALLFPLAYLIFLVPVGESLVPLLQDFTAAFTVKALRVTGIPVFAEGRYISIPSGKFQVAEACSGIRYLIASVAVGSCYAYLSYRSNVRRLIFCGMCIFVPIIANGFRAYGIVVLAHLSDMKLAVGVDHIIYGWIFFGVVMFVLFWIGSYWRQEDGSVVPIDSDANAAPGADIIRVRSLSVVAVLAVLLIGSGPLVAWVMTVAKPQSVDVAAIGPPMIAGEWQISDVGNDDWNPKFVGADESLRIKYTSAAGEVHFFTAFYRSERQGSELINSQNHIFDRNIPRRWVLVSEQTREVAGFYVRQTVMRSRNTRRLVWYWYSVDGQATANPVVAKLLSMRSRLTGGRNPSTVVAIAADFENESEPAAYLLRKIISDLGLFANDPSGYSPLSGTSCGVQNAGSLGVSKDQFNGNFCETGDLIDRENMSFVRESVFG